MKKVIIPVLCLVFLYGCSDNKDKNKTTGKGNEQNTDVPDISKEDRAIKEWLLGKEWKADNGGAPFEILKVFSLDSLAFSSGRLLPWSFKNGRLEMIAEWPLTRVNDTTFTIYVEPTKKTYAYQFVRNL